MLKVPAQLQRQRSDSSFDSKGQRSWMKKQITRLEHVLNVLQSGQQKLLSALEQRDLQSFRHVLEIEDVKINEPLSKHSQITALLYASANVRCLLKTLLIYQGVLSCVGKLHLLKIALKALPN